MSSPQSSARFPKTAHLLKHADFERVYEQGRRQFATHLTMFYRRRDKGTGSRVGFTVSRALGGSVTRNRIRRRVREAVRSNFEALPRGYDVVINPKRSAEAAAFPELKEQVARAFAAIARQEGR